MEHGGHDLDNRRLVRVVLGKLERELEGACEADGFDGQHISERRLQRWISSDQDTLRRCFGLIPPSHGVSSGPKMTAFHFMMLSGFGEPLAPSGGSDCSRLKSLISRCKQGKAL